MFVISYVTRGSLVVRDMMSKQITYQKRDPVLQIHASISPKLIKREAKE
jgi:hypothetical protein